MGMNQRVGPLLDWLRAATVEPQKSISALTSVDLADSALAQRQGISTRLVPLSTPMHPPRQKIPLKYPFHLHAPAPPPASARQVVMSAERWGVDLRILFRICNTSTAAQLPDIWQIVAPLKKDSAISMMEAVCWRTDKSLRFLPPRIPHAVEVKVMALACHSEDPEKMGDALNIFLFPNLYPLEGLEVALLTRK